MKRREIIIVFVLVVLTALSAQFKGSIPGMPVPITLQSMFLLMGGLLLRFPVALLVPVLYIALGIIGLPVFAGGASGWEVVSGPTGGFFAGFVVAVLVLSLFPRKKYFALVLALLGAHVLLLVMGFGYLVFLKGSWEYVQRLLPLLPGALIKSFLGAAIVIFVRSG